jgi:L-threonylcarbamoyladenylate synthase
MHTKIIPTSHPNALKIALQLLRAGEIIAFPTDTVYGVGALAFDATGAQEIYRVKQRPPEKALPILLGDFAQVSQVAAEVTPLARKLAAAFLPGALTIILPKHPKLPREVSALDTIGVRVPNHAFARALLRAAGAMAVSSANLSGADNPQDAKQVYAQLNGSLPLILDGGRARGSVPSTVVDCCGTKPIVLREGPVSFAEIQAVL